MGKEPEPYGPYDERFYNIMFAEWSSDELAYMHHKVMHPSYSEAEES